MINRAAKLAAKGTIGTTELDVTSNVKPELFEKDSERSFFDALSQLGTIPNRNYTESIAALSAIAPRLTSFFDGEDSVLVMDPNPEIKQNRLNLLGILRNQGRVLADFGAIVKS